jgi:hypothetical protein
MSLINLSLKHGRTLEEARGRLGAAVVELEKLFGPMVRQVTWNAGRDQVRIDGAGFWVEMSVDAQDVRATGDIPSLAGLLGGPLRTGLERVVRESFRKQLR